MKKRLLTIVLALVMVLACAFNVIACDNSSSSSSPNDGTYYLYQNDEYIETDYIKISDGNVSAFYMDGESVTKTGGKVSSNVSGTSISVSINLKEYNGKISYKGEIKKGIIHFTSLETYFEDELEKTEELDMYYCKKGKTPDSGNSGNSGNSGFKMPNGGFNTDAQVEIKLYHTMGQNLREVLLNYLEQFNEIYPNIIITLQQFSYDDLRDQIVLDINYGNQPNLAFCYPDHVALFNQSKAVLPLNDFLSDGAFKNVTVTSTAGTEKLGLTTAQENAFIPAFFQEGYQFDDGSKMYTLPFAKSTEVLYYNKTYFQTHNIAVPTTWDEMEAVCARIKQLDPSCKPLGYDSEANWFINMCEQYGSPYTTAEGNARSHFLFDNQTNRNFVTKFKGWYNNGYVTTQKLNNGYTSSLFTAKQSYMCIGSSAAAANMIPDRASSDSFEVGIAPIPQVDPNSPKVISQGPSLCIFKQDDPQEVLASWLLAKFLTTNVNLQAQYSSVSGYVPVLTTVKQNAVYQSNLDSANGYEKTPYLAAKVCMAQASSYFTTPAFAGSSKARDEVGYLMLDALKGSKTVDQAFRDAIEACEYFVG